MSEIADFLRARLAERREGAKLVHEIACDEVRHDGLSKCDCGQPETIIADLDAKLAIVKHMDEMLKFAEGDTEVDHYGALDAADQTLRHLAQPFAGHPDHKGVEWTP